MLLILGDMGQRGHSNREAHHNGCLHACVGHTAAPVLLSPRGISSYLSQEGFLNSALHEASVVRVVILIQLCRDDRGAERRQGQWLQPGKALWEAAAV